MVVHLSGSMITSNTRNTTSKALNSSTVKAWKINKLRNICGMSTKMGKKCGLALILIIITSCGVSNVVIDGSFPTPNIGKLPVSVAVIYDDALREFVFMEYTETGEEEFNIEIGGSHIQLFNAVLPAMFDEVVFVNTIEEAQATGTDAIFAPVINEFQLGLPAKTKLNFCEVWVEYNMRLLTTDGDYIADWIVTSYGRTPNEAFRSTEAAINDAAVVALRSLASNFSLNFDQVPEVRTWLSNL